MFLTKQYKYLKLYCEGTLKPLAGWMQGFSVCVVRKQTDNVNVSGQITMDVTFNYNN